ncbi:MAG: M3 family metallopeptidase [Candidatus Andeanibacterium colombiense]|uniref:oligopeptidase A n=1 Tax=Candidatus Andeanibacterium colombiense TaxID=3121345 RepID=A0AAJ6BNB5_9SPHN|nr:MAG: M3 family metallopeptidase [Sphingomonadaceae bacterium]
MNDLPAAAAAPAIQRSDFAPFDRIVPASIEPQLADAVALHRAAIERICESNERNFESVLLAREAADLELAHMWSPIGHLHSVADTPALRDAYAKAHQVLTEHGMWVSQNRALYDAIVAARWGESEEEWTVPQRRLRALALRDFELSGVSLDGEERDRFREVAIELAQLGTDFSNAVLDATDAFHVDVTDAAMIEGIPEGDVARFRAAAAEAAIDGWRIGIKGPDVQAVMTYAVSRALRFQLYEASVTRASDQGPHAGQYDNGARIERIMALRHEATRLLGFASSAERSLATKMAPSPDEVECFLLGIAGQARAPAEADLAQLREAAAALGIAELEPWDVAYVSERVRRDAFALDAEALRAYFPADTVIAGTMGLIEKLFGIRFTERNDVPVWHEQARYYDVLDRAGATIAGVYVDLFARDGKRGGAWMDVCRQRFAGLGQAHLPVAFLTCNFAGPSGGKPATLRHDDVVTFLHEFGHVLHHILTEVDYPSIGGISGVEWDAVELPSQLMENFAWDHSGLWMLSGHVETGEPLPRELFDRMTAARNFQSGLRLCRQVEFALFDLRLHRDYDPSAGGRVLETLAQVRGEVAVIDAPAWHRFPHSFGHIFAGGYSAGYYSYLWAELLSADAYGRFREAGGLSPETGEALRGEILSRGATRTAAENFAAFRGRDPDPRALLDSYGIAA